MNYLALACLLISLAYGRVSRRQVRESRKVQHFWMETAVKYESENHRLRHYIQQLEKEERK